MSVYIWIGNWAPRFEKKYLEHTTYLGDSLAILKTTAESRADEVAYSSLRPRGHRNCTFDSSRRPQPEQTVYQCRKICLAAMGSIDLITDWSSSTTKMMLILTTRIASIISAFSARRPGKEPSAHARFSTVAWLFIRIFLQAPRTFKRASMPGTSRGYIQIRSGKTTSCWLYTK